MRKSLDCERWLKETCDRLGGLDILINCAAGNFLVSLLRVVYASGYALYLVCSLMLDFHIKKKITAQAS